MEPAKHHPLIAKFTPHGGEVPEGKLVDFLGVVTDKSYSSLEGTDLNELRIEPDRRPHLGQWYFEYIDVFETAAAAEDGYTMIELGAGWGRWLVRGARVHAKFHPGKPSRLIGVEAEPSHFQFMLEHFRENGLDPADHTLIEAAVNAEGGQAFFTVGDPAGWYGQTVAPTEDWGGGKFNVVKVKAVTLQDLLRDEPVVDMVHADIQGAELEVFRAAIRRLNRRVKRVTIATHGAEIEEGLRALFRKHGWECLNDYGCFATAETPYGAVAFDDGVQTWVNPHVGRGSLGRWFDRWIGRGRRAPRGGGKAENITSFAETTARLRALEEDGLPEDRARRLLGGLPDDLLREVAEARFELRPIRFDPAWAFGRAWESTDPAVRVRRMIWEELGRRKLSEPIRVPWHLDSTLLMPLGPDLTFPTYVEGSIEPNEFAFLRAFVRPGMRVVDLGANWGLFAVFLAKAVGPGGQVICFEPSRRELKVLRANLEVNDLRNVVVVECAAGEEEGEAQLRVSDDAHPGQSTLGDFVYAVEAKETDKVRVITLDGYFASTGVEKIDLIKMDIEGAEMRALRGARETLKRFRPPILLELMDRALAAQGSGAGEVVAFLKSCGYTLYRFSEATGRPVPAQGNDYSDNIVAIVEGDASIEERVAAVFGPP